ncbi:beta-1,3-galactosyltransferase 1-like [Ruditapes philippinarum]|uniref:beta-1,3-galactosyltransferase 1-like n=1 Tax=Ruditapes philippinarum TaxID=129788 RepID=UPI00295AF925|nr:beta-1,3-galactosyltransferase 1-like [Ruditapes philippinarum]
MYIHIYICKMKVKKKWTHLSVRRVTTQFMLLTFTAIVIYVCLNLVSSSSTMSLKVDMFIKMQGLKLRIRDSSGNGSYQHNYNKSSDGIKSQYKEHRNKPRLDEHISNSSLKVFNEVGETERYSDPFHKTKYSINHEDPDRFLPDSHGSKSKEMITDDHMGYLLPENQSFHLSKEDVNNDNYSNIENNENKTRKIDIFGNIEYGADRERKLECDECFQHNFKYVIENDICKLKNSEQIIDLIVLITTSHKNTKARAALRATWLSFTRKNTDNIRYAFLLGEHTESRYNELVLKESNIYHDIIQEDFVDSYMNLTSKNYGKPPKLRAGSCTQRAKPIRQIKSKWYASIESYPQQLYPGFCSGTGYVTSMNVASKVYHVSPSVPFFHLEDVYVALCLRKLGFKLQRVPGFNVSRRRMDPCLFKGRFLISAHHMSPILLQMIWNRHCTRLPI